MMDTSQYSHSSQPVHLITLSSNGSATQATQDVAQSIHSANQTQFRADRGEVANNLASMQGNNSDHHIRSTTQHEIPNAMTTATNPLETLTLAGIHPSRLQLLQDVETTDEHKPWNFINADDYANFNPGFTIQQNVALRPMNSQFVNSRLGNMDMDTSIDTTSEKVGSHPKGNSRRRGKAVAQARLKNGGPKKPKQKKSKQKEPKQKEPKQQKPKQKKSKQKTSQQVESYLRKLNAAFEKKQEICAQENCLQKLESKNEIDTGISTAASERLKRLILEIQNARRMAVHFEEAAAAEKPSEDDIDHYLNGNVPSKKTQKFVTYFTRYRKQFREANDLVNKLDVPGFPELSSALKLIISGERVIASIQEFLNDGLLDFQSTLRLVGVAKALESHTQRHLINLGLQVSNAEDTLKRLQQLTVERESLSRPDDSSRPVTNSYANDITGHQYRESRIAGLSIATNSGTVLLVEGETSNFGDHSHSEGSLFMIDSNPSRLSGWAEHHQSMTRVDSEHHILGTGT